MCGIAGAAGKGSETFVLKMLEAIKHRGPDGIGTFSTGDITIGNTLLGITGNRGQPIYDKGALTFNGEIYNFRDIAKKLHLITGSDSETIFNLIEFTGIEAAIKELDGDYAFAYVQDGKIHLARDPAGIKPLYYAWKGGIFAFASEKKALSSVGMNELFTLKPGHMLSYSGDRHTEKKVTGFTIGERISDEKKASTMLYDSIKRAVEKRRHKPCAIAFSGGLDSSFIAALARGAELYSVGMAGSHDVQQTEKAAQQLGLEDNLHLHELTIHELEAAIPDVIAAIESADPIQVGIAMPLFITSGYAHTDGIRVMLSGQGADELFAGYKRYESMNPVELEAALKNDLCKIAENNLERDDAATMANSVELRVPYLDREVVELALRLDPELKIHKNLRKYILRLAAESVLPEELVWKEKRAAQYSSGIYSALEKLAKKNGYRGERFLGRYLEELRAGSRRLYKIR